MIEDNNQLWKNSTDHFGLASGDFRVGDMTEDLLPEADVLLTKDTIIHLSNALIERFLITNVLLPTPRYRYVLFAQQLARGPAKEKITSGWGARYVDVSQPPFNLSVQNVFRWGPGHTVQLLNFR